ncbi:MAG: hypothetical protein SPK58_10080 [Lachnospiraceae bacterium]|nr:hypothetical protein [Lachnospiraceae bacterium]
MRRGRMVKIVMSICLMLGMILFPVNQNKVQAAEVIATVQGTVMSGTTADLLKLSTEDGKMEIKLDSGTDTSACKILLPGTSISVSVSHGSDGYLHAVKISGDTKTPTISVDSSSTATVTGTISEKTKDDVLYVNTVQGEMQIKLDTTTNMSGCSILVADKTYDIVCARGSDAYMHAISISDAASSSVTTETVDLSLTPAPTGSIPSNVTVTSVTGTVGSKTKEDLLYLSTKEGEMQFVIDNSTDSRSGMFLIPGRSLTVTFYHGSDAYLHATNIAGIKTGTGSAKVDTSSLSEVTGTVNSKSTESMLYLDTIYGEMELKLDTVNSVSGLKVIVSGKKLNVSCARGDDAYMHAVEITGA